MGYYLRRLDYSSVISDANLDVILKQARGILGDADILAGLERNNIAQMKNSMRGRWITDNIFESFKDWSIATNYYWNDRIDFTASAYSATTVYASGDLVLYGSIVYEKNFTAAIAGTLPTDPTYFTSRGASGVYFITPPDKYDEYTTYAANAIVQYNHRFYKSTSGSVGISPTDTGYWERITDFSTYNTVGHWPNETAYWTFGDNRDASVIECLVDMIVYDVHATINPRNIPALRDDRYKKAMSWLSDIRKGLYDLDLPQIEGDQKGYRLRFGSNPPSVNYY